jgi:hypothetical protein
MICIRDGLAKFQKPPMGSNLAGGRHISRIFNLCKSGASDPTKRPELIREVTDHCQNRWPDDA